MKVEAPELSALITILRSVGQVIYTRRSSKSFGCGAIVHSLARSGAVSGMKSGELSGVKFSLARRAQREQILPAGFEGAMQLGDEAQGFGCQDPRRLGQGGRAGFNPRRKSPP